MNVRKTRDWLRERDITAEESFTDALRDLAAAYKKNVIYLCSMMYIN